MASLTISNFPLHAILAVSHVEFCSKMLYFTNALRYCYETWYESSARCPGGAYEIEPAPPSGTIRYSHAYNFGCGGLIFMTVTFLDSLILAESSDTKRAMSCLTVWATLHFSVFFFFQYLRNCYSDQHETTVENSET